MAISSYTANTANCSASSISSKWGRTHVPKPKECKYWLPMWQPVLPLRSETYCLRPSATQSYTRTTEQSYNLIVRCRGSRALCEDDHCQKHTGLDMLKGNEQDKFHKEALRRLRSVGEADGTESSVNDPNTNENHMKSSRYAESVISPAHERLGAMEKVGKRELTAKHLLVDNTLPARQNEGEESPSWSRRSVLNCFVPLIIKKLTFSPATARGNIHSADPVTCKDAYEMKCKNPSLRSLQSDSYSIAMPTSSTERAQQSPSSASFMRFPDGSASAKFDDIRIPDSKGDYENNNRCLSCSHSGSPSGTISTKGTGELWHQAADDPHSQDSSVWRGLLTTLGLGACIICGTFVLASSDRFLKFGPTTHSASTPSRTDKRTDLNSNLMQYHVVELTHCNFEASVSKKPTFVLFYASWCSHCQQLEHTWKDLACRLPQTGFDVQLAKIDSEKYAQVAEKFKVVKYPTLIFFKDGKPSDHHCGPRDMDSLLTFIDENYSA